MTLGDFLAARRAMPWQWGSHDCCAFVATWAGVSLPNYANEDEAEAMLHAAGGLVPLWEAAAIGKAELVTGDPKPGDVGVIEAWASKTEIVEIGAIFTGVRWAFVPKRGGIAASSAQPLKVWRPLCHRR